MAFKTVKSYNDEKYGGYFILRNDGDYADVVFLYQSVEDVLVADVHYIKSADYSGYAHCCGKGCPACAKGIRTQTKLFIPVYNIQEGEIQYFDRTMRFEPQLQQDVFSRYPNPSEYVFRITRHGAAGSTDTTYEITAIGKNTFKPYAQILMEQHATMPEHYNTICRDVTASEMKAMLDSGDRPTNAYSPNDAYSYDAVPRGSSAAVPQSPVVDQPTVSPETFSAPPEFDPAMNETDSEDPDLVDPTF